MKICSTFQTTFIQNNQNKNNSVPNKNIAQFIPDTVSFGAMKKCDFKGIDRICVEKFKAPIEKFNKNEDLQSWAGKLLNTIIKKDYKGRQQATVIQRKSLLKEWGDYVTKENDAYNNSAGLLIMSSITKDLKPENDVLPPVLNKGILSDVMSKVDNGQDVNILKEYKNTLKNKYLTMENKSADLTGWIVIPSKSHDAENFDSNVEKLQTLSHHNWCTHRSYAEPYLSLGDFHVYLEKGNPKLGVRFVGNKIQEIQGEKNNARIPNKYLDVAKKHVKKYRLSSRAKLEFNVANNVKRQAEKLREFFKGKDDYEIFGYLGYLPNSKGSILESKEKNFFGKVLNFFGLKKEESIKLPERKSKNITLAFYKQPNKELIFEDFGIDENKLFQNVKKIQGKADFSGSKLDSLNNLETISGKVDFAYSQIKDLCSLKRIGGDADFNHSIIKDLGNLGTILRTSVAFRVDGVVLFGDCADLYNPKCVRASVGNLWKIPVVEISSVSELEEMFHQSIDNYLAMCAEVGKAPDKEFKGSFNVRISPELHREISIQAAEEGITLNQYVLRALENSLLPA